MKRKTTAKLNQKVIEFEDIVVEDSYFSRSGINMEQSIIFRNDEIRRAPGAHKNYPEF